MFSRSVSTAVVATATAVVLAAQTASPALADPPGPPPSGRSVSPGAPTAPGSPGSPGSPGAGAAPEGFAPGERPLSALLRDLGKLYRKTETADRKYQRTDRRLDAQRAKAGKLEKRLKRVRSAVNDGRAESGRLARHQYQGDVPGLPPLLRLLLADDPRRALQQGHALRRAVSGQSADVKRLISGERRQSALVEEVREALDKRRKLAERHRRQRNEVRDRLREVEKLLSSLSSDELTQLDNLRVPDVPDVPDGMAQPERRPVSRP